MRSRCFRRIGALLTTLALSSAPAVAAAQGFALNRFVPAPAGDRMFGVESPFVAGHLTPHVALLADYAHNPLVIHTKKDDESLGAVVGHQLFLHLNGSLALWNRLNVNLDVPVAIVQGGDDPATARTTYTSPGKAQFGDLRLGLRARIWGEYDSIFQIAVGGYV